MVSRVQCHNQRTVLFWRCSRHSDNCCVREGPQRITKGQMTQVNSLVTSVMESSELICMN